MKYCTNEDLKHIFGEKKSRKLLRKISGKKIIDIAEKNGIAAAHMAADESELRLFAVDVGPGSRVEVWDGSWTRQLAIGQHVSRYVA